MNVKAATYAEDEGDDNAELHVEKDEIHDGQRSTPLQCTTQEENAGERGHLHRTLG
jgi:hypothetical protein